MYFFFILVVLFYLFIATLVADLLAPSVYIKYFLMKLTTFSIVKFKF